MDGETNEAKATKILERFEGQAHLFFACEHDKDATVKARELWDAYFSDCFDETETFLMGLRAKAFEAEKNGETQDRAAHTQGNATGYSDTSLTTVFAPGVQDIELEWIDENGARQKRRLSRVDLCRMADSHADLLAALEECIPYVEGAYECAFPNEYVNDAILAAARAAIAKAKGATPAPMTRADEFDEPTKRG